MLMDPMGGIVMTNDGNAILREVCNIYNVHCLKNISTDTKIVVEIKNIIC